MNEHRAFTVYELYLRNESRFPFWLTNDRPRHLIFLCTGFGYFRQVKVNGKPAKEWVSVDPAMPGALRNWRYAFVGETYTLDDRLFESSGVLLTAHDYPGWLPA